MGRIVSSFIGVLCLLLAVPCGCVAVVTGQAWFSENSYGPSATLVHADSFTLTFHTFEIGGIDFSSGEALLWSVALTTVLCGMSGVAIYKALQTTHPDFHRCD